MAADHIQFLKNKFIYNFQEAVEELKDGGGLELPLHSHFDDILDVLRKKTIITPTTPIKMKNLLHSLNSALTDCVIMSEKLQSRNINDNKDERSKRCFTLAELWLLHKTRKRLRQIKQKLLEGMSPVTDAAAASSSSSHTFPIDDPREHEEDFTVSTIHGFDEQLQEIEEMLLKTSTFKAIGMVGVGGSGKTALAKMVSKSSRVLKVFEPVIWVSLSETLKREEAGENSRKNLVRNMLEELGCRDFSKDLNQNVWQLHYRLLGKKYLIVLDDAWHCHLSDWYDELGSESNWPALSDGSSYKLSDGLPKTGGGCLIVTSRFPEVARRMVGKGNLHQMQPVKDSESIWSIFMDVVKRDGTMDIDPPTLLKMKDEIVYQCDGLPLAAKTLAKIIPAKILEHYLTSHRMQ